MNLRIAPEQIRFRITADEFATLIAKGVLEDVTQLSETLHLSYSIRTNASNKSSKNRTLELSTSVLSNGTRFELTLFIDGINQLRSGLCVNDGLREHLAFTSGDLLSIGLEIDLHSKKEKH